jgi:hypothetical protein
MFRVNNVDAARAGDAWARHSRAHGGSGAQGTQVSAQGPIVRPQKNPPEWRVNVTQIANAHGDAADGTDAEELSAAEIEGRRQIVAFFGFLREEVPGFENAYILEIAPQVGIRETRRVVGEYQLTEEDVLGCASFDGHHRRQRLAGRGAREGRRDLQVRRGGIARVQPPSVPHARPATHRQPAGRRALRLDDAHGAIGRAGERGMFRDGAGRGHGRYTFIARRRDAARARHPDPPTKAPGRPCVSGH